MHITVNGLSAPDPHAQKRVKWSVWYCLCFLTVKQPSMWVVSGLSLHLQADKAQLFRAPPSLSGSHGMGSVAGRPGAWPALVSPQKTMQE